MPQRVANVSVTVHRKVEGKDTRQVIKAGDTFNFTKDEIDQLTKLNPNAVRKPVNEELPEEANDDGSKKDSSKDVIDTTNKDSELTPAEKAAQTRAANKAAKENESGSSDEAEGL